MFSFAKQIVLHISSTQHNVPTQTYKIGSVHNQINMQIHGGWLIWEKLVRLRQNT